MGLIGFLAELIVIGCIGGGLACTGYVVASCNMLELGRGIGEIGPWRADISIGDFGTDGCEGWDKADSDDKMVNMARACSMMALCFGCIFAFFFLINQWFCALPLGQKLMDVSATGGNISLALVWFIARADVCDDYGCSWGSGATTLMCAHIFYFAAGVFTRCMREPRYKRPQPEPKEEPPTPPPPPPPEPVEVEEPAQPSSAGGQSYSGAPSATTY